MKIPFFIKNIFETKTEGEESWGKVETAGNELKKDVYGKLGRSLFIRLVDSGSCNACENELSALSNPYYDLERFGLKFVASPKHADILFITGCMTRNMLNPVLNAYNNIPEPKFVVTIGDCAGESSIFRESYAVMGPVSKRLSVVMHIDGCPPEPKTIISSLISLFRK